MVNCSFGGAVLLTYSPPPQGPLAAGALAGHSACLLAHTGLGWWCSPGQGSHHLWPRVSLRLVGSSGCGTRSPCGAAPRLGPRELCVVVGWATGPLKFEHLPLRLENQRCLICWTQQVHHRPHGASGHLQMALEGQRRFADANVVIYSIYFTFQNEFTLIVSVPLNARTHSCQRGLSSDCRVLWLLCVHLNPAWVNPAFPDSGCLRTDAVRTPCCLMTDHQRTGNHLMSDMRKTNVLLIFLWLLAG